MTRVKICGISRVEDGLVAVQEGADLLGFIFYPPSHRYVEPEWAGAIISRCRAATPSTWRAVGVFVNVPAAEANRIAQVASLDYVQLAGDEDAAYCASVERSVIKVVRVDETGRPSGPIDASSWNAERILLDTERPGHWGGTGETYDWEAVRPFAGAALLAGGLRPENAAAAIAAARPWGLDVSSGVERHKRKDPELIRRFLREVKRYDRIR